MKVHLKKVNQAGFDHVMVVISFVVAFALVGSFLLFKSLAATVTPTHELVSGLSSNACLAGGQSAGSTVYLATCNGTPGERWHAANGVIENAAGYCLEPTAFPTSGNPLVAVVSEKCSTSNTSQKWSGTGGNPEEIYNTAIKDKSLKNGDCLVYPNNDATFRNGLALTVKITGCSTARPSDQLWTTNKLFTSGSSTTTTSNLNCIANTYASGSSGTCVGYIQQLLNYHTAKSGQSATNTKFPLTAPVAVTNKYTAPTVAAMEVYQKYTNAGSDVLITNGTVPANSTTWESLCNPWKIANSGAGGATKLSISEFPGYPLNVALDAGCSKYIAPYYSY